MMTTQLQILLLVLFLGTWQAAQAQKTVEFRISTVFSNVDDMDFIGDSDPQWDYAITDNTFSVSASDDTELGGTNCPGLRTIDDVFFTQTYDCDMPSSYTFVWSGREDDPSGGDANTGDQTVNFTSADINPAQTNWTNVFAEQTATASGDECSGGGTVTWRIQLQYRVTGGDLCKDECIDPYVIPTAAEFECQTAQTSTPLSIDIFARKPASPTEPGHASDAQIQSECGGSIIQGSSPEEVWVRTTIPDSSGGVIIQFENHGGCTGGLCQTNVSYAWYTSSDGTCNGLEYRGCGAVSCVFGCNDGELQVDGRAGEDVWVRIWEEDDQGFHIEINQITPTAPADRCYTAMPLGNTGCNYQATAPTSGTYAEPDLSTWTAGAHPDLNPASCSGTNCICQDGDNNPATNTVWTTMENLVWYTFTQATTGPFDVTVLNMTCSGGANTAQLGVFTNSGTAQSPTCDLATETGMGCSVGVGNVTLSINSLPAGEYFLVVDGNAGAECEWTFQSNTLLALVLYDFKAVYSETKDAVELNINVQTDANRDGLWIQRSIDGVSFVDVEFLPSQYNAVEGAVPATYSYEDNNYPLVDVVYYRLKDITLGGMVEYSGVRAVNLPVDETMASVLQEVFPNPAQDKVNIPFIINSGEQLIHAEIYDMQGRLVLTPIQSQVYAAGKQIMEVSVGHLPRGMYMLRFTANDAVTMRKFSLN